MPEIKGDNQATNIEEGNQDVGENSQADAENKSANTDAGNEDASEGGEGDKGDEGEDKNKAKAPDEKNPQSNEDDDDNLEPSTRKTLSKQDFIIGRQKAKLAKQKEKETYEEDDDNDDGEVAPEDERIISNVISKKFAPLIEKTQQAEDDREINAFLAENPDFKPFEAKARRYIQHPSRAHLPVKTIFYEVAGDKLLKIGAERRAKADEDAKSTQTGGGSNRAGSGGEKSTWEMSEEEFEAEKEKVRRGQ